MQNQILWQPTTEQINASQMNLFRIYINNSYKINLQNYQDLYNWSISNLDNFWRDFLIFSKIIYTGDPTAVIEPSEHISKTRWFPDIKLNFAENLLKYKDKKTALIFANENGIVKQISYAELHKLVAKATTFLRNKNIKSGDIVAGYLPNMPEATIWMLASTAIGAIWSSTSPDFGEQGVLERFSQISPKVFITTDGYFYNQKIISIADKVITITQQLPSIEHIVIINYINQNDKLLQLEKAINHDIIIKANNYDELSFIPLEFDHPSFILYSSGTTGKPKTILHRNGGVLINHIKEHMLHTNLTRDDVLFYFTTTGWMMWNWLTSGLSSGATIVLYDGSPFSPNKDILWQLSESLGITVFGTSAKYLSTLESSKIKPSQKYNLTKLRTVLSTGSILAEHSFDYVYKHIKSDVLLGSISGGTDIISCFALCNPTLPVYRGELQSIALGYAVMAYDMDGTPMKDNNEGELVCIKPFPSMPLGFYNDKNQEKFMEAYFNKFDNIWYHGDYICVTNNKGVKFLGRSDTTLNPQGVRIGSGEIYEVIENIDQIEDSIIVGELYQNDEILILFVKLKPKFALDEKLIDHIKNEIKSKLTPRHVPSKIIQVNDIPYTINGKKVEIAIKNIVNGKNVTNTSVIKNPECLKLYHEIADKIVQK